MQRAFSVKRGCLGNLYVFDQPPSRIQPRFGCQINLGVEPEVGGRPTNIINVSLLGVHRF
jgi:hypothetical protein